MRALGLSLPLGLARTGDAGVGAEPPGTRAVKGLRVTTARSTGSALSSEIDGMDTLRAMIDEPLLVLRACELVEGLCAKREAETYAAVEGGPITACWC